MYKVVGKLTCSENDKDVVRAKVTSTLTKSTSFKSDDIYTIEVVCVLETNVLRSRAARAADDVLLINAKVVFEEAVTLERVTIAAKAVEVAQTISVEDSEFTFESGRVAFELGPVSASTVVRVSEAEIEEAGGSSTAAVVGGVVGGLCISILISVYVYHRYTLGQKLQNNGGIVVVAEDDFDFSVSPSNSAATHGHDNRHYYPEGY